METRAQLLLRDVRRRAHRPAAHRGAPAHAAAVAVFVFAAAGGNQGRLVVVIGRRVVAIVGVFFVLVILPLLRTRPVRVPRRGGLRARGRRALGVRVAPARAVRRSSVDIVLARVRLFPARALAVASRGRGRSGSPRRRHRARRFSFCLRVTDLVTRPVHAILARERAARTGGHRRRHLRDVRHAVEPRGSRARDRPGASSRYPTSTMSTRFSPYDSLVADRRVGPAKILRARAPEAVSAR